MKLTRCLYSFFIVLVYIAATSAVTAAVVTYDVPSKSLKSDSISIVPKSPVVRGEQASVCVESAVSDSISFKLCFTGIKDQDYDLYVNGAYAGIKTTADLKTGIQLSIPGRIADPVMVRCLSELKDKVWAEHERLSASTDSEAKRIAYTLGQADDWIRSGLGADKTYRSIDVIIAPSGMVLTRVAGRTRTDADAVAATVTRACWLMQQARDRMYDNIKNPVLRNDAVVAMTPVKFTATYTMVKGKPHIDAKLVNDCNLPISGNISMAIPKGWKTTAKKLSFDQIKGGKTISLAFDLIAPSKKAIAPDSIPIAANITVTQDIFSAGLKLKTDAVR